MFRELIASDGVVEECILRDSVGVLALHGGLEDKTAETARRIADEASASLYAVIQPDNLAWHVPSTQFDPIASQELTRFLDLVDLAVSVHGFGRKGFEGTVLVGGSNASVGARIAAEIERQVDVVAISDIEQIPEGLRGLHPRNPVNLPEFGGVQLELSPQVRAGEPLAGIVAAVATALSSERAWMSDRSER